MIQFNSFSSKTELNCITLSADLTVAFECAGQETYAVGTPKIWDDYLITKVPMEKYDVFQVFAYIIPKSKRSRITDHKKVWGLREIPRGVLDCSYDTDIQTVYLGITQLHGEKGFKDANSSLLVLLPTEAEHEASVILESFVQCKYDFGFPINTSIFSDICRRVSGAIVLLYQIKENASLTIYSHYVDSMFLKKDFDVFSNVTLDIEPAHRLPFCNLFAGQGTVCMNPSEKLR